jgi:hypothetical protein
MPELHPRTADLVNRFAAALKEKLATAQEKYGYSDGWADPCWVDECRAKLIEHVHKGDPRDVAAYCAFLWHHGARCGLEEQVLCFNEAVERAAPSSGWSDKPIDPAALVQRIDAAIQRITSGNGAMRVPAENSDPDLVLADCKKLLQHVYGMGGNDGC